MFEKIFEIKNKIVSQDKLKSYLKEGKVIILKGEKKNVGIGKNLLIKVNASIGLSNKNNLDEELRKLKDISELSYGPDTMMDLSIVEREKPLYEYIIEQFGGPVGTLPHYYCYKPGKGFNQNEILEEIEKEVEKGVSFMTLHLTPRRFLYQEALQSRTIPCTSRGGSLIVKDMYLNRRSESILSLCFSEILKILKKYKVALSVGTTFRPGNIQEALDSVHCKEVELQREYVKEARRVGVPVMMEGVGHISLEKIKGYLKLVKKENDVPFMPLGPIPTDSAIGYDHVASVIGVSYMAFLEGADIINSITREEHTGNVPNLNSIIEGIKAARLAAHIVNVSRYRFVKEKDFLVSSLRAKHLTCVVSGGLFNNITKKDYKSGCSRCGYTCPLINNRVLANMA